MGRKASPDATLGRRAPIEEFARAVHASYLARWAGHDPAALDREVVVLRRRRRPPGKASSA